MKEIRVFARYFCAIALGREPHAALGMAFHDLRELKVEVAYPFLLELYDDYQSGLLSAADFGAAVRLVEAYVFRRAICAIPSNSLGKTFATFGKASAAAGSPIRQSRSGSRPSSMPQRSPCIGRRSRRWAAATPSRIIRTPSRLDCARCSMPSARRCSRWILV